MTPAAAAEEQDTLSPDELRDGGFVEVAGRRVLVFAGADRKGNDEGRS